MTGTPATDINSLWTLIFTSGTTGTTKGVMHDYNNVHEMIAFNKEVNPFHISCERDNRFFSCLPLNHIAERSLEMMAIAAGGQVFFTENLSTFPDNLQDVSLIIFFAISRIWTKFMQGILAKVPQAQLDVLVADPVGGPAIKQQLAAGLGLANTRLKLSGAASIPQATKDWFATLGLPIGEVFGKEDCSNYLS